MSKDEQNQNSTFTFFFRKKQKPHISGHSLLYESWKIRDGSKLFGAPGPGPPTVGEEFFPEKKGGDSGATISFLNAGAKFFSKTIFPNRSGVLQIFENQDFIFQKRGSLAIIHTLNTKSGFHNCF